MKDKHKILQELYNRIIENYDDDDEEYDDEDEPWDDPSDEGNVNAYFPYGNMLAMFKNRVDAELNNSKSPYRKALKTFLEKDGPWPRSLNNAVESFLQVLANEEKLDLTDPETQGNKLLQTWYDNAIEDYYQSIGTQKAVERAQALGNKIFLIWCKKLDTEMKTKDTLHKDNPGVNIDI